MNVYFFKLSILNHRLLSSFDIIVFFFYRTPFWNPLVLGLPPPPPPPSPPLITNPYTNFRTSYDSVIYYYNNILIFLFNFRPTSEQPVRARSIHVRHDTTKGRRRTFKYYRRRHHHIDPVVVFSLPQTTTAKTKTTFGSRRYHGPNARRGFRTHRGHRFAANSGRGGSLGTSHNKR